MITMLLKRLDSLAHTPLYWIINIASGVALMAVALFYQYELKYDPCIMCIHVRLLVTLWIIVSTIGLITCRKKIINSVTHVSMVLIAVAFIERSYQLLGTERGFVFGDCGFDLGMPSWFAIEEWLPSVYRIETSCGYTPELIFGITMAEALMVFSIGFLLLSFCVALVAIIKPSFIVSSR